MYSAVLPLNLPGVDWLKVPLSILTGLNQQLFSEILKVYSAALLLNLLGIDCLAVALSIQG